MPPRAGQGGPQKMGKLGTASADEDRRSGRVLLGGFVRGLFPSFGLSFEGYFCLYLMSLINQQLPALILSHGSNEREASTGKHDFENIRRGREFHWQL